MRTYDKLNDFLKQKREAVIPFKKVAIEVRELMKVREGMRRLLNLDIFDEIEEEDNKSVKSMKNAYLKAQKEGAQYDITNVINEFVLVK